MKRTTPFILLILIFGFSFAQIDDNMMNANWKIGKEKEIYGNKIYRHQGNNDTYGMTNVGYQTFDQVKEDLEEKADREMWTAEKKQEKIESYKRFAAGGIIHLYLTRLTIDAANTDMFSVIVRDSTDINEIYREDLKSEIPEVPSSGDDYWWNYTTISISQKIVGRIYIYVIDKLGRDNSKFKFEVKL